MGAKTRGSEQVRQTLQELDHYMSTMGQHYRDSSLKAYQKELTKIREEFEFADIDLNKYMTNKGAKEVQTDPVDQFLPGFDTSKLIKLLEERDAENR